MAKNDKEIDILNDVINLLIQVDLTANERSILQLAKQQLEKHVYFPRIISDLELSLTPLAMQQKLSKSLSPFYLKINIRALVLA